MTRRRPTGSWTCPAPRSCQGSSTPTCISPPPVSRSRTRTLEEAASASDLLGQRRAGRGDAGRWPGATSRATTRHAGTTLACRTSRGWTRSPSGARDPANRRPRRTRQYRGDRAGMGSTDAPGVERGQRRLADRGADGRANDTVGTLGIVLALRSRTPGPPTQGGRAGGGSRDHLRARDVDAALARRRAIFASSCAIGAVFRSTRMPIVATMDLSLAIRHGLTAVGGDLPTDGSIGARTRALHDPYHDSDGSGRLDLCRRRTRGVLPRRARGRAAGRGACDRRPRDRTGADDVGAGLPGAGLRERRHFRARRHRIEHFEMLVLRPDRASGGAGAGGLGAARVRPAVGRRGRPLRTTPRYRSRLAP